MFEPVSIQHTLGRENEKYRPLNVTQPKRGPVTLALNGTGANQLPIREDDLAKLYNQ